MVEMQRRKYLATIGATVSGLALAGCSEDDGDFEEGNDGGDGNNNDGNSGGNGGNSNEIELQSHEMVRENEGGSAESVKVEGEAENVSGGELDYAEVEVKFYEGDTLAESSLTTSMAGQQTKRGRSRHSTPVSVTMPPQSPTTRFGRVRRCSPPQFPFCCPVSEDISLTRPTVQVWQKRTSVAVTVSPAHYSPPY